MSDSNKYYVWICHQCGTEKDVDLSQMDLEWLASDTLSIDELYFMAARDEIKKHGWIVNDVGDVLCKDCRGN